MWFTQNFILAIVNNNKKSYKCCMFTHPIIQTSYPYCWLSKLLPPLNARDTADTVLKTTNQPINFKWGVHNLYISDPIVFIIFFIPSEFNEYLLSPFKVILQFLFCLIKRMESINKSGYFDKKCNNKVR